MQIFFLSKGKKWRLLGSCFYVDVDMTESLWYRTSILFFTQRTTWKPWWIVCLLSTTIRVILYNATLLNWMVADNYVNLVLLLPWCEMSVTALDTSLLRTLDLSCIYNRDKNDTPGSHLNLHVWRLKTILSSEILTHGLEYSYVCRQRNFDR